MKDNVSIIIPVYNTEASLPRCLDSCIGQSWKDIEIIIVIDGSRDNSARIAKEYCKKDTRITIIEKDNEGLPLTRRRGFDSSKGDFIFHLDSDDYIEPDAIETLMKVLLRENADIVIGGTQYERRDGQKVTTWVSRITEDGRVGYLKGIFTSQIQPNIWGRLIRREVFEEVYVPARYNCGEDYLANIIMICNNPEIKIVVESTLLYHYIVYNESLTNTWPAEVFMPYTDEIAAILMKHNLEEEVMDDWAWYRVIKSWRYYLRRGGKKYLANKTFVSQFYKKYLPVITERLKPVERFELNTYIYSQLLGYIFSRVYLKLMKFFNSN